MSLTRGGQNAGHYYSNITKPYCLNLNFVVDAANGNGLGIRSLKSNGWCRNVFMHTSQTPGSNDGATNPNPAVGFVMVQFKQNFNAYLGGFSGFVSSSTGSTKIDNSALTAGQLYLISTLGNATLAKWQAIGVPVGVTPAVGVSFIALTNGGSGNTLTSRVSTPVPTGIVSIEAYGDSNLMTNSSISPNGGQYVYVSLFGATNSSTTTLIPTAPPDGSVISMSFFFDGSSVTIDGL